MSYGWSADFPIPTLQPNGDSLTVKSPIAQLIGVTVVQFTLSIVDPSILAQPLAPATPTDAPGAVKTSTTPVPSANPHGSSQPSGTARALQQGATQPSPKH